MSGAEQSGSRVIWVAGSLAELPDEVHAWLRQQGERASACTNIYDALATLTIHPRPAALVVNIELVDWQEMEFFDWVAALGSETTVYVVGGQREQDKIDAALRRGARRFDTGSLTTDLDRSPSESRRPCIDDLLAGSLQLDKPFPARFACYPRPVRADSMPPAADKQLSPDESVKSAPPVTSAKPSVRLVGSNKAEQEVGSAGDTDRPVPFPWAPAANRPKRIPPRSSAKKGNIPQESGEHDRQSSAEQINSVEEGGSVQSLSVELTADELSALMNNNVKPPRSEGPSRRSRQS